jgi:hypothetical protein
MKDGIKLEIEVGIAHQKIVRDKRALTDEHESLFGNYWKGKDLDLRKTIIRPISLALASKIIIDYEWLGCMPAVNWYAYGIYFGDDCGGCVVFGPEYSENLGVWDKYDYTGKMILLSRGVCLHWTPINTGSKLIMGAISMLPLKFKVITATTDHLAGEVGTIYQACNFYYVGSMRESNPRVNGRKMDREGWMIKGKLYGSRSIRSKIGNQRIDEIRKHYPDAQPIKQNSKHRYFLFRGSKKEKKYFFEKIKSLIKEYPKRAVHGN